MSNRHQDPEAEPGGRDARWLTGLLDTEAGRYSPDRHRIRAAVHQRTRGGRHREYARSWPPAKTAGIAATVLAAAAAVAVIVTFGTRPPSAGSVPTAASGRLPLASGSPATPAPAGRTPPAQASGGATPNAAGDSPVPTPTPPSPSTPGAGTAPVSSAGAGANLVSATGTNDLGSFPYWLQEEVAVSLREPVTALQLTVTVTRSAEVASTGYWTTDDPAVFDVTVAVQASTLTYTFTLKPGQTLPAGSSAFAVQFNHGTNPHNPAADTYALSVTAGEQNTAVQGTAAGSF